jgi:hypothetical protein
MGKQIRFFMEPEDESSFLGDIGSLGPYYVIRTSYSPDAEPVVPLEDVGRLEGNLSIYNLALVQPDDMHKIKNRISNDNLYHVDLSNSPVIQFNRCRRESSWLRNGRLWFQESLLTSENQIERKTPIFCQWARSVLDWVKRRYTYLPEQFAYAGPLAHSRASNIRLQLGPPLVSSLSVEERKRILGL